MNQAKYSGISDVPLTLAVFLANDNYDHNSDPYTISATTLIKPIRQIVLPPRIPPGEALINLADLMDSRIGSAIHDAIERSWLYNLPETLAALGKPQSIIERTLVNPKPEDIKPDSILVYTEQRVSKKLGKWTISGKWDMVIKNTVEDYKKTSTYAYMNQSNTSKWSEQGSIYRWLDPVKVTNDVMNIHYIFTDWKRGLINTDPTYPTKAFYTQKVELMSLGVTNHYITNKLNQIEKYWDADESDIPHCSDEDLWRSKPVFKYYKNPSKTVRSTKNFDTMQEALIHLGNDGSVGIVKEVPGTVKACNYCAAFPICSQAQQLIACGDLLTK